MVASVRSLVLALVLLGVAMPAATAAEVRIRKAAVGNSVGPGGEPQLDIHLVGTASSSAPGKLVGYFSDGDTGAPLAAPQGSSFSTTSGQVAASSGSIGGHGLESFFQTKMSIPHFALNIEPLKKRRVQVSLFLDPGSSGNGNLQFVDELGFDVILDNPFDHSKKGKHGAPDFSNLLRPRFRTMLPDPPAVRPNNLGRWNVYTAFDPAVPLMMRRRASTSIFVEKGRSVTLGGNALWQHEGSGDAWQGLYDALDTNRGVVLPKPRFSLRGIGRRDDLQVTIEARFIQVDDTFFREIGVDGINGADPQPQFQNQGLVVEPGVVMLDHRMVKFDFTSNRVEAYHPVPELSRIPLLNRLFTGRRDLRNNRTLLILLAPQLVSGLEE